MLNWGLLMLLFNWTLISLWIIFLMHWFYSFRLLLLLLMSSTIVLILLWLLFLICLSYLFIIKLLLLNNFFRLKFLLVFCLWFLLRLGNFLLLLLLILIRILILFGTNRLSLFNLRFSLKIDFLFLLLSLLRTLGRLF